MKKFFILLFLCSSLLYSKIQTLVKIEPSEEFYPNLSTQSCNTNCLFNLLRSKLYLSYISEFNSSENQFLVNIYAKLLNSITDFEKSLEKKLAKLDKEQKKTGVARLALIIPEKTIKSYSNVIINSSIAYLLRQGAEIQVKVFLIGTESEENIKKALEQAEFENFNYAVAGLTLKGMNTLNEYHGRIKIFVPTIHKNTTYTNNENIYFGGIDYDAQISALLERTNSSVAIFSDDFALAHSLNSKITNQIPQARIYKIVGEKLNFRSLLYSQGSLNGSTIFFNTPLIKTALASSQLRIYGINPQALLSTQINYNPSLLSLTQNADRRKLFIANSISQNDDTLSYMNEIFNQNLDYNWIAYATSLGVDYFYTQFLSNHERLFEETLNEGQFIYKVRLMQALQGSFEESK